MHRLRLWAVVLIAWLLFIVNVEQSSEKFLNVGRSSETNILEWHTYILLAAVVLATLIVPVLRRPPLWAALTATIALFLGAKLYFMRNQSWETNDLLQVVTELSAVVLTLLLTRQLDRALDEFREAVSAITIPRIGKSADAFSASQGEMYREVRRARQCNRPLTLLALKIKEDSVNVVLQRIMKEAQRAMKAELVLAEVAGALCDELQDYNIIGWQNGYFLVLLPEIKQEDVPSVTARLCNVVFERAGVKLQVGAVTFPDQALTFEGLVQQAIQHVETPADSAYLPAVTRTQPVSYRQII